MATVKSYSEYIKDAQKLSDSIINGEYEKTSALNTEATNKYIDAMNSSYDTAIANQEQKTENQIAGLNQDYRSAYEANAVQAAINRRQIAESMANTGRTDSGLNRTQQTAIEIAKTNADNAYTQQMNAQAASIRQQLADYTAEIETQKAQTAATAQKSLADTNTNLYSSLRSEARSRADSIASTNYNADISKYNAEVEAAATKYKAELEAQSAATTAANTAAQKRASTLATYRTKIIEADDTETAMKYIASAMDECGLDGTESEFVTLLKTAGVTEEEFQEWINDGAVSNDNGSSSGSTTTKTNGNGYNTKISNVNMWK